MCSQFRMLSCSTAPDITRTASLDSSLAAPIFALASIFLLAKSDVPRLQPPELAGAPFLWHWERRWV